MKIFASLLSGGGEGATLTGKEFALGANSFPVRVAPMKQEANTFLLQLSPLLARDVLVVLKTDKMKTNMTLFILSPSPPFDFFLKEKLRNKCNTNFCLTVYTIHNTVHFQHLG